MTIDQTNRVLYNPSAEASIIGSMVMDERTHKHIGEIDAQDFVDPIKRRLFVAIRDLAANKKKVDLITLDDATGNDNKIAVEIMDCMHATPTSANIKGWIALLKDASRRRRVMEIADGLAAQANDRANDMTAVVEGAREALRGTSYSNHAWMDMSALVTRTVDWIERRTKGGEKPIQSGIADIDRIIGGFFPGEMTVIGARPGAGKSQMGMNIAMAGAKAGKKVCFVSLEMIDVQYGQRVFSREAMVNGMRIRNALVDDGEWERIIECMGPLSKLPASFLFGTYMIEDIISEVQRKADTDGIDMLVVDYLQLVRSRQRFESDRLRVANTAHVLKRMTEEFNIPVIALAQVGRDAEGDMPQKSDLRDSGDIEQDADNIIFMHKPRDAEDKWVSPKDCGCFDSIKQAGSEYVVINVDKQRQGQTGYVGVISDAAHMRYVGIDRTGR
ncbi:MAG: DnaB-like helicase C-terminal domain-containing protein [Kiritimatiellales bacterium]